MTTVHVLIIYLIALILAWWRIYASWKTALISLVTHICVANPSISLIGPGGDLQNGVRPRWIKITWKRFLHKWPFMDEINQLPMTCRLEGPVMTSFDVFVVFTRARRWINSWFPVIWEAMSHTICCVVAPVYQQKTCILTTVNKRSNKTNRNV